MRFDGAERRRFLLLISIIGLLGTVSLVYILLQQRLPNPLIDTYRVSATLPEADGVVAGLGQPVNVAGVKVGTIVDTRRANGNAVVTLEIEKDLLPEVRSDATVALEPITPLKDMQINLDPGTRGKPALASDDVLPVGQATSPVPLANLLETLDADTRTYFQSLVQALDDGTEAGAADLRKTLRAFGPTTRQVGAITRALASRREEMARLVTNLAVVTEAASRDEQLATVVAAGNRTLQAVAAEDAPLRAALAKLPSTLDTARSTLVNAQGFARALPPAVQALHPGLQKLPDTLDALEPFAREATTALQDRIRPLVRQAPPLVGDVGVAVDGLNRAMTPLWGVMQNMQYLTNMMAHNPPDSDEGHLYWLAWFAHNMNSGFSVGDAHGGAARAMIALNCSAQTGLVGDLGLVTKLLAGSANLCPTGASEVQP